MLLFLVRLAVGVAVLGAAAWADWRTREAGNWFWMLLGSAGIGLFAVELGTSSDYRIWLLLVPWGLLLGDLLWDRDPDPLERWITVLVYVVAAASAVTLILTATTFTPEDQALLRRGLGTLVVFLLGYLFYTLGLLKGGADAKALIAIAYLVPGYPEWEGLPLLSLQPGVREAFELFFPFALSTLLNAALLLLAVPVILLVRNLFRRDVRWPQMLLGSRVSATRVPRFTWLLQEADRGRIRYFAFPRKTPQEPALQALRELGVERVWVTPQIPFLVPLALSFALTFLVGNLLFGLL